MNTALKAMLVLSMTAPALCHAQANSCDAKRASLEQEITYARAHGNANRVDGLETALAKLNANCTDASLRSASQRKVADAQKKLREREHDLNEAKAQGKSAKKIAERQRKVDEAHAELERAQTVASN
jgi:DNA-binding NarL/FixJ family response regulator